MKLVALISGGKDSLFNMLQCIAAGHEIVAVANIEPETKEELDSYMYQSVGHQVVSLIAVALELPIYRQKTKGKAYCKNKIYTETNQDEVEDLVQLLQKVKKDMHIEGVAVGAIASDYQRTRVENVCARLGLKSFAYLWRRNQSELLQEMIDAELDAIIIKVACIGLNPDQHLGMHIKDLKQHLSELNIKYGVNVCGEGGEYETLTIDCPLFNKKISIIESENLVLFDDAFAPVSFLNVKNAILKPKIWNTDCPLKSLQMRLDYVKSVVKDPYKYIEDCVDEVTLNIFPEQKNISGGEILPFPFEPEPSDSLQSTGGMVEYWKTPSASSSGSSRKYYSSPKKNLSLSTSLTSDISTSNLNYSTGWCCVGNVTGSNVQEAFSCLQTHLDRIKYEFRDIVFVNLFLKDMSEFQNVNRIYCQYMPDILPPARVCVAVPLPSGINVLIIVVAHKFLSKSQKVISSNFAYVKEAMHVQSISHWAPANIGPYSQCVRVGDIYYLAGQIPLVPGTMQILNKPILHQCKLSVRHISRILQAMNGDLNLSHIFHAICYVTSEEIAHDMFYLWPYITQNDTASVAIVVVSGLPKNAQLEFEVAACGYGNPKVYEKAEVIADYSVKIRRCVYFEPYTSSFVCKISTLKGIRGRKHIDISVETLMAITNYCLQFIRKEVKNISLHLCMLKLFYKSTTQMLGETIYELIRLCSFEHKVVVSAVPVVACRESDVFVVITGVCH